MRECKRSGCVPVQFPAAQDGVRRGVVRAINSRRIAWSNCSDVGRSVPDGLARYRMPARRGFEIAGVTTLSREAPSVPPTKGHPEGTVCLGGLCEVKLYERS